MRSTLAQTTCLSLTLLIGAACGEERASPAGDPSPGDGTAAAPLSPISSRSPAPPPGAPEPGGSIEWTLPAGWLTTPPANPMRMAQAEIPGSGGVAEMAVFYFGPGGGGGVQDNLDRWAAQMEGGAQPERGELESGPFRVTWISKPGAYDPGMMGMGPSEPQPGWRLLGAVVEGSGGPWFFKITGPEETVVAARDDFFDLLRSVRPTG